MVEISDPKAAEEKKGFTPTEEQTGLILQHLGDEAIVDKQFNATVTLSKEEAERRAALVEDVEYFF